MSSLKPGKKWNIKLSRAGLVYCHFGRRVIGEMLGSQKPKDEAKLELLYDKMYEDFVMEIDAVDNGVDIASDGVPRYHISTDLSSRVSRLNPNWNSRGLSENEQFHKAMALVLGEFKSRLLDLVNGWLPAREIIESAIKNRLEIDESGAIILLDKCGCPWKDHLFSVEKILGLSGEIKFVLFPDTPNGNWRVQCVPLSLGSFTNRLSLKEEWQGLRDQHLSDIAQIKDCIFVHATGFIGGNKTYDGALEMARKTLAAADAKKPKK